MRSLAVRILVSLAALLALGAVVLVFWAELQFRSHGPERFHHGALELFADQAEQKWASGNKDEVRVYLDTLEKRFRSQFQWLDSAGNDILGVENHPELFENNRLDRKNSHWSRRNGNGPRPPFPGENGRIAFVARSGSGLYHLVEWVQIPPPRVPLILFSIIGLVLCLFGAMMSLQVVRPMRKLQGIVESFGKGDLQSRSHFSRTDEIGDLARSFNRMADQISTLVERERGVVRSVAHEVRGPLTRMSLLIERVRNGRQVPETLDRLDHEIKTLSQIPDLLLQLSLVESGRAEIKPMKCNLKNIVREIVDRLEPSASGRQCQILMVDEERFDIELETDPAILGRSLENILDNALRYSPEQSKVEISVLQKSGGLELQFRDFGPGVPEVDLDSIFRPFFRCDSSRTRNTGGLGLGLAITRSCVEALGGRIWATNATPGLQVSLSLPLVDA